jgi:hypothetical protein
MSDKFADGMVQSPERAEYLVVVPLRDASDQSERAAVSVHAVMNGSVINFWRWRNGQWQRLLPEWQQSGPPTYKMLGGMLQRASQNSAFRLDIGDDRVRFLLADVNFGIQHLRQSGEKIYDLAD